MYPRGQAEDIMGRSSKRVAGRAVTWGKTEIIAAARYRKPERCKSILATAVPIARIDVEGSIASSEAHVAVPAGKANGAAASADDTVRRSRPLIAVLSVRR
jgi:hypothetical protein